MAYQFFLYNRKRLTTKEFMVNEMRKEKNQSGKAGACNHVFYTNAQNSKKNSKFWREEFNLSTDEIYENVEYYMN